MGDTGEGGGAGGGQPPLRDPPPPETLEGRMDRMEGRLAAVTDMMAEVKAMIETSESLKQGSNGPATAGAGLVDKQQMKLWLNARTRKWTIITRGLPQTSLYCNSGQASISKIRGMLIDDSGVNIEVTKEVADMLLDLSGFNPLAFRSTNHSKAAGTSTTFTFTDFEGGIHLLGVALPGWRRMALNRLRPTKMPPPSSTASRS